MGDDDDEWWCCCWLVSVSGCLSVKCKEERVFGGVMEEWFDCVCFLWGSPLLLSWNLVFIAFSSSRRRLHSLPMYGHMTSLSFSLSLSAAVPPTTLCPLFLGCIFISRSFRPLLFLEFDVVRFFQVIRLTVCLHRGWWWVELGAMDAICNLNASKMSK